MSDMSGMSDTVNALRQQDSRRVFATLVRVLHSLDLAEGALHCTFVAAAEDGPRQGLPASRPV